MIRMRPRILTVGAATVGTCLIVATAATPALRFAYDHPGLHMAVETTAVIIGSLVAYLAFGRYRRHGRQVDLALAGGLGLLVLANLVLVLVPALPAADRTDHIVAWVQLAVRGLGAGLLVRSALVGSDSARRHNRGLVWIVSGLTPLGLVALAGGIASGRFSSDPLPLSSSDTVHLPASLAVAAALALLTLLFALAATGFMLRAQREGDEFIAWMGGGCAVAALASLSYLLFPPLNPRWFYTADLLLLGACLFWLVGGTREIARYWSELAQMAVRDERRRMARDLHDGMAQELAFITTQATLAARGKPDPVTLVQLGAAAQRALDESRRAIAALATDHDELPSMALADVVEDLANRFGLGVHLDVADDLTLAPKVREALLWIVREAVTNAARHGRADAVTIRVQGGRSLSFSVHDDGCGFDPGKVNEGNGGFGLTSMRERAEAIGAGITVRSTGAGTTVTVG